MVINDLDVFCARIYPTKADSIPIIQSNAMLAGAITFKSFKAITGQSRQIIQRIRSMQASQFNLSFRVQHCGQ
jgi:hypothetical protein